MRRLSLSGLKPKKAAAAAEEGASSSLSSETNRAQRRASLSTPLKSWVVGSGASKKMDWVRRSITAAAVAVDKATANLFIEDPMDGDDNEVYHYEGMVSKQLMQGRLIEFKNRYRHLIETLGDLSLAADVDPDAAASLLRQSQAQENLDTMLGLLRAEERQNSRTEHARNTGGEARGGGGDSQPDLLAAPCLEFVLEERIVKLICELGAADRPAGTMALMLGACASLLGQVSHPLLPSKAVHDPISKLIAAAGSYGSRKDGNLHDSAGGVGALVRGNEAESSRSRPTELAQAAWEEVQTNLARLLGAIWRKLREESALLDFFLRPADQKVTAREGEPWGIARPVSAFANGQDALVGSDGNLTETACVFSLDVFSILLPLLELPGRAGLHAREACLVALSVKDKRVGMFVRGRTNFCTQLSRSLTARYLALYDTLEELQAAAAFVLEGKELDVAEEISVGSAAEQLEEAEGTFSEALTLFLQHLRFCNAVGLVAADSHACVRPRKRSLSGSQLVDEYGDVASSLASQIRQLLLGEAIGPALSSELESRAGIAQAISARIITELSVGVEGYGVAAAGIAALPGEEGGRRQLGPLLDEASALLIGREESLVTSGPDKAAIERDGNRPSSAEDGSSRTERRVTLREVLLRRVSSSSPALRVSTLELVASLAELRDDRVLLDLALRPEKAKSASSVTAEEHESDESTEAVSGREQGRSGDVHALLETGGPLEGLRVTRDMADSFGAAFGGSPIHPNFRRFSSLVSLEKYLVQAHQRQIQQLMMEARAGHGADEVEEETEELGGADRLPNGDKAADRTKQSTSGPDASVVKGLKIESGGGGDKSVPTDKHVATGAPATPGGERFGSVEFSRQHGHTLASEADAPGSFLHALFDCLEAIFERTLDENVALTGVLSSLCLAATAAEVSPVRRLLLVLLFDGTPDAPFRSMRRALEKLWGTAQARVASLSDAPRLLARARASLGMAAGDFLGPDDDADDDVQPTEREENHGSSNGVAKGDGGGHEADASTGGGGGKRSAMSSAREQANFLETYVFLEEFLKELFCALQAKSYVEKDARGLTESHRRGTRDARQGLTRGFSVDEAEAGSPYHRLGAWLKDEEEAEGGSQEVDEGVEAPEELPTSLDEFLRTAEFPTLVSPRIV